MRDANLKCGICHQKIKCQSHAGYCPGIVPCQLMTTAMAFLFHAGCSVFLLPLITQRFYQLFEHGAELPWPDIRHWIWYIFFRAWIFLIFVKTQPYLSSIWRWSNHRYCTLLFYNFHNLCRLRDRSLSGSSHWSFVFLKIISGTLTNAKYQISLLPFHIVRKIHARGCPHEAKVDRFTVKKGLCFANRIASTLKSRTMW